MQMFMFGSNSFLAGKILALFEGKIGRIEEIIAVPQFNDDPKFSMYSSLITLGKGYSDGTLSPIYGNGISFSDPELALIKCLGESIERVCLSTYKKEKINYLTVKNWPSQIFPLSPFNPDSSSGRVGYVNGISLTNNKKSKIPADLVYLNYQKSKNEINFHFPKVSTGAAGGFERERTILNAIYEIIERDSFMNIYLGMIPAKMIDPSSVKSPEVKRILSQCARYNLEFYLFDISTDLEIPSFLSVVIDRTGVGPAVSMGAKAGLNVNNAIEGSMLEAFLVRNMLRNFSVRKEKDSMDPFVELILERGMNWYSAASINNLGFLLDQKPQKMKYKRLTLNTKKELGKVVKTLGRKGYDIYATDISVRKLSKIGYKVFKVLIPGLMPLYLYEDEKKFINNKRLRAVCEWFGLPIKQNPVPHPFL